MKTLTSLLAVCAIIVIGFISCSKTGDTGPAGPAGPDSVYSSQWINLTATNLGTQDFEETLVTPSITKGILDSGIVLSYANLIDSLGNYHVVPMAGLESLGFYDEYTVGNINIFATSDFSGVPYRYVTIPGSKTIGNGTSRSYNGYSTAELRLMTYDKVQQVVGNNN